MPWMNAPPFLLSHPMPILFAILANSPETYGIAGPCRDAAAYSARPLRTPTPHALTRA